MFKLVEVFLILLANHPQADPLTDPQFSALVQGFYRASGNAIQLRLVKRDGALYRIPAEGPSPTPGSATGTSSSPRATPDGAASTSAPRCRAGRTATG